MPILTKNLVTLSANMCTGLRSRSEFLGYTCAHSDKFERRLQLGLQLGYDILSGAL